MEHKKIGTMTHTPNPPLGTRAQGQSQWDWGEGSVSKRDPVSILILIF